MKLKSTSTTGPLNKLRRKRKVQVITVLKNMKKMKKMMERTLTRIDDYRKYLRAVGIHSFSCSIIKQSQSRSSLRGMNIKAEPSISALS